ncbi:MAG: FkbM family methyltransferase [Saprospiraceae bacterium]|nr:FkbM family methyltransferase [Saprospiraceae bacterium]
MIEAIKYLYRAYRYRYRIDPVEIAYILRSLKPGDIAVDIGCHKGGYLYWMRKRVGKTGQCYAFEPQPRLYQYLNSILQRFVYQNITLENKGVSSNVGTFLLYIPKTASGASPGASLNAPGHKETEIETREIQTVTLDGYFYERGIVPNLLKIDVEGHEAEVLKGGAKLIQEYHPRILMECETRHLKQGTVSDILKLMQEWGYHGYFIMDGKLLSVEAFDPAIHQKQSEGRFWEAPGYVNNFVFEQSNIRH